jgi:hypothetical protein
VQERTISQPSWGQVAGYGSAPSVGWRRTPALRVLMHTAERPGCHASWLLRAQHRLSTPLRHAPSWAGTRPQTPSAAACTCWARARLQRRAGRTHAHTRRRRHAPAKGASIALDTRGAGSRRVRCGALHSATRAASAPTAAYRSRHDTQMHPPRSTLRAPSARSCPRWPSACRPQTSAAGSSRVGIPKPSCNDMIVHWRVGAPKA